MGLLRLLGIEKYLKKVKTYVDEKTAIPNWDATATEKGFVENRTHYKNFGVWSNVSVVGVQVTISGIDNYEYVLFKGISSGQQEIKLTEHGRYNVQFDGVGIVQITVIPANNTMLVTMPTSNIDAHVFVNERIRPFNIVTLEQRYLPEGLATEEYVDEKITSIPQNGASLISILEKELPILKIDVNGWTSAIYTFAQLGITDEYVDRWLVLQSLKVTGGAGYRFELLNSNEFSEDHCEMHEGSLNFKYIGTEGDGSIEFDIIRKTVYISNDWE